MTNFDTARQALEVSLNSAGSAMREHEKASQSLEFRLNKLKSTWQSLSQTFMGSDFLKGVLDVVIGLVNGLDKLIDTLGLFPTLVGVVTGGFSLFKNGGIFKTMNSDLKGFSNHIGIANKSFSELLTAFKSANTGGIKGFFSGLKSIGNAISNPFSKSDISSIEMYNGMIKNGVDSQEAFAIAMKGTSESAQNLVKSANGGKVALDGMKTASLGAKAGLIGAKIATVAFNAALTIGISLLIDWVISGIQKLINAKKDLAEKVEEVTSKFKDQHAELQKLKGDFDTSDTDSMISKYGRLSKGVNELGENVSLTTSEYSEYKSIVDTIANQFPSLVSGYNSQGDAVLKYAGNIDKLAESYRNLIIEQNEAVLDTGADIFKDFKNDVENTPIRYLTPRTDEKGNVYNETNYDTSYLDNLRALLETTEEELNDENSLINSINELTITEVQRISETLNDYGIKRNTLFDGESGWENEREHIYRALEEDKKAVKKALEDASVDLNEYAEELGTATQAYFSTAFLGGDGGNIDDYSHFSDRMQNVINQVTSNFGSDFYAQFLDDENPYESLTEYYDSMLKTFDSLSDADTKQFEAAFNLETQFNNGKISYGEYIQGIKDVEGLLDGLVANGLDGEVANQIKLTLDSEQIKTDYEALKERLTSDKYNIQMETKEAEEFLGELTASEYQVAIDLIANKDIDFSEFDIDSLREYIKEQAAINEAMSFATDIEVDTTALETLNGILAESASAMGLTEESIDSLKAKYSELESFDASTLFEATGNGIKVNRDELVKLEKEYNDLTKSKVKKHLETLADEYNDVTTEIDKCRNAGERAQLLAKRETYKSQIEELAEYQAQLEGVTGAYQRWLDAQNTPEDYEGYQAVATSREDIQNEIDRGFISNATKEYIDLLSGEDLVGGTIDDYYEAWKKLDKQVGSTSYTIHDFFTVNDDGDITSQGIDRFFDGLQQDFKGSVYKLNEESGKWEYDFSQENLQKIQDEWGLGIEAIELLLEAAASAGYDIDWGGILDGIDLDVSNFETLVSYAEKAQKAFNKLEGVEDVDFNFTATGVEEATSELEKARSTYIDLITNDDGSINLKAEGAEQMRVILSTLLVQKQQLEDSNIAINIDTSGLDESQQDIANAIEAVKTFREKYKNLEIAVTTGQGIDTAKSELSKAMGELQTLGGEGVDIAAQLILGEGTDGATLKTKVDAAIAAVGDKNIKVGCNLDETAIGTLNSQILTNFTPEATVKITGIDDALVNQYTSTEKTAEGTVKWKNDESLVVEYQEKTKKAVGIVDWANNTDNVKKNFSANGTVKWTSGNKVKVNVISEAYGTAHANGSTGRSFARGNWGIKGNGTALGGELAPELLIRNGKWHLIGEDGAEFFNYRQNDIIFNAAQTESLFKYGGIKGAKPRGKMLANGSAFAGGNAFAWSATTSESKFANNKNYNKEKAKTKTETTTKDDSVTTTTTTSWNAKSSDGGKYANNKDYTKTTDKDEQDKFEDTFDAIEIAISRVEREMDNLDQKVGRTYTSWTDRNRALEDELYKVNKAINVQEQARDAYEAKANSIGLPETWAQRVRDGSIGIYDENDYDEDTGKKIKEYQTWYEKMLQCEDAIEDLRDKEYELYKQDFDNVIAKYDGELDAISNAMSIMEQDIEQSRYTTHISGGNNAIYNQLINREKETINQLSLKKEELEQELNRAVANGLSIGSEDWREMRNEIDATTLAIKESWTNIFQYKREMFDEVSDRYDAILQGYDHTESMLNEYISQAEAKGQIVSKTYYQELIKNENAYIAQQKKQQAALIKARDESGYVEGSEEWTLMSNEIDEVTRAIEESNTAIIEWNNSIRDVDWHIFDLTQQRISDITDEAEFLIELMSNEKLFDDNGKLTEQGLATMGLRAQNYNTHMYQADDYGKEVAKIEAQLAKGYDENLEERRRELIELQRESILAAEDEKNAIRDLVEESINEELDALDELIEKKNEALESERELYEYQKKVKEQTKEIASLEKQMAAYSGDSSEEAKAKIQELKISLEEAKANLEETQYEKMVSDQQKMLDSLYLEYETILNSRLDNVDALINDVINMINTGSEATNSTLSALLGGEGTLATSLNTALGAEGEIAKGIGSNAASIKETLTKEASSVGTKLSDAMNNIWSGEGNERSVLTTYGNDFSQKSAAINTTLNDIKTTVSELVKESDKEAEQKVEEGKTQPSSKVNPITNKPVAPIVNNDKILKPSTNDKKPPSSSGDGKPEVGDRVKFVKGQYYYDSQGKKPLGYHNRGGYVYITKISDESWSTYPIHISTGKTLGTGDLGWLKKNQIEGYATGKKRISDNEYAWTQENGQEFIVRPSDGAILTPVAKGDSVLNATATGNIWSMANSPAEFIRDNLKLDASNVPNGSNVQNSYMQNLDKVVFNFPNVKSYDEMLAAMQKDKNFERLLLSMTIDRIAGKSPLAKGKSIR